MAHLTDVRSCARALLELGADSAPEAAVIARWIGASSETSERGLAEMTRRGLIDDAGSLTDEGRRFALASVRRFLIAECFLVGFLELDEKVASEEAVAWGGALSAASEAAIWQLLGRPDVCPHGEPIPTG